MSKPPAMSNDQSISQCVLAALKEDLGGLPGRDLTALLISADQAARADLIARESCVLAGQAWFERVFVELAQGRCEPISINWLKQDGETVEPNETILTLSGNARCIVSGERTAMNFLQTLSATATATRQLVTKLTDTNCRLLDTRKTIPGLRSAQKYAVLVGGGQNHRLGLFDAFLIKENHIVTAGGIGKAIEKARAIDGQAKVEIEVENLEELSEALHHQPDVIMLDNFSLTDMRSAVTMRNERRPNITLEASGNITLNNIEDVAHTGVDSISVGAITKHIRAVDLSLRLSF